MEDHGILHGPAVNSAFNYVQGDLTASVSEFCKPGGMVMYMDGFHLALDASSPEKKCINLWLTGWTLDSVEKFYGAMFVVVMLGIATEGMGALRIRAHKKMLRRTQMHQSEAEKRKQTRLLKLKNTGFHGIQGLLGYMLMLAVMTYSIEMLFSCLCGVMLGYNIFYSDLSSIPPGMNSNPCCDFMTNITDSETEPSDHTDGHTPLLFNSNIDGNDPLILTNQEIKPGDRVRKRFETRTSDEEDNEGGCCGKKAYKEETNATMSIHNPLSKDI